MLDISVLIPFKDKSDLTISCIKSLQQFGPALKEILLISNNSSQDEVRRVKEVASQYRNTQLIEYNHPFNYQKINNFAASRATGKVLFLLNNDIELTHHSTGLIESMYEKALEKQSGAVGCVLVYEDRKTIQHAGVYLVAGGTADHLYIGRSLASVRANKGLPYNINRNLDVVAVTAAALMVKRTKFEQIHGMNEDFVICGGDVDLCLRLLESGYKNTLIGADAGYMIHKESKSRSMISVPYVDFYESYRSYVKHFDYKLGDPKLGIGKV